ncbi:MAG TPA: DUF1501 domain-containing protein [Pyrinomonadaceae bacterium]|nr:DUF1501 domain-containing protein [Pyrinomonadaceae bacterium]
MKESRREFIGKSCRALTMAAVASQMSHLGLVSALAQKNVKTENGASDYKALVCVFLNGGNDANNMVVPKHSAGYSEYSAARSGPGLAIPLANLLSVTPPSIGLEFGLHPALTEMQQLWNQNKFAVVCNVGTLIQPITKAQYLSGAPRPEQLFSHSDQVNQFRTAISNSNNSTTGWGGRLADRTIPLNVGGAIPMVSSIAGVTVFSNGAATSPLIVEPSPTPLNQVLTLNGFGTTSDELARKTAMQKIRNEDLDKTLVQKASFLTQQAINVSEQLSTDPTLTVTFPNTTLGNQLRQVAKLMKFRTSLNMSRQIFFVQLPGFDTHVSQLPTQNALLTQFSQAMKAFYDETVAQGISGSVTTFTMSDFNRTLNPAGALTNVGSDHAWAGHHFVMGDSVAGGNFYGRPTANGSIFPTLVNSGPDDVSTRGRFVPTVSVEMYAATLARWFGLNEAEMPLVFPFINNFPTSNLGFML